MMNKKENEQESPSMDAVDLGQQTFENALKVYASWMTATNEVQTEAMRFVGERLKKDLQMPAKFAACGSPFDIYQEQIEFASTMVEDYADESRKIAGMLSEAIEHGSSQFTLIRP